jgi:hypothetical protein
MAVVRDSKARAKRIDLAYLRRLSPFRRWKRWLSYGAAAAAAAWVGFHAATGDDRIYARGPMSPAHALLANRCDACHSPSLGDRYLDPEGWQARMDAACVKCHDGPAHHATQIGFLQGPDRSAGCSVCHREHEGTHSLSEVSDRRCVSCHGDLKSTGRDVHARECLLREDHAVRGSIHAFDRDHPEFAAVARQAADPTRLKFNHGVHLFTKAATPEMQKMLKEQAGRPGVAGGAGGQLGLTCSYCHVPDSRRAYFLPVRYDAGCQSCHPLAHGEPPRRVPHVEPAAVRDFFRSRLADSVPNKEALADKLIEVEERVFMSGADGCAKCHAVEPSEDPYAAPPKVLPTGMGARAVRRWLPHSNFNHDAHRELQCVACHSITEKSVETSRLHLPSRATCLSCHVSGTGAGAQCVLCHSFHNRRLDRGMEGGLRISDLQK